MIVTGLSKNAVATPNLVPSLDAVTGATERMLKKSGLHYEFLGVPVMQLDVRLGSHADRWTFNIVGFSIGLLMCLVLFRNARLALMGILCPAANVLWSFGTFGLLGFPISFFMNAIPPVVMVISFAEAMHLTYGIRRRLREGDTVKEAVHETIRSVGPACVLTTTTTSVAFLSLVITDTAVIRDFGLSGAISVLLIFVASMLVVPSLAVLLLKGDEGKDKLQLANWASDAGLDRVSDRLADFVPRYPLALAAVGTADLHRLRRALLQARTKLSTECAGPYSHAGAGRGCRAGCGARRLKSGLRRDPLPRRRAGDERAPPLGRWSGARCSDEAGCGRERLVACPD